MKNLIVGIAMVIVALVALVFVNSGCDPECEEIEDPNIVANAIQAGDIVTITDDDIVQINGITVGRRAFSLTTGCFGIPECVSINDTHRGVVKKSIDDFAIYDDVEEITGTTYFSTEFYGPYWAGNAAPQAFRAVVNAHSGGAYENKRQGCCANNPEKCHCYE
jgi:predicted RecA/RadA family phage recombinase